MSRHRINIAPELNNIADAKNCSPNDLEIDNVEFDHLTGEVIVDVVEVLEA